MNKKIFFVILLINLYFIINLFLGKNNIINFLKFKNEITELENIKNDLIMQRYKLEKISIFLSDSNSDNYDVLDEIIRQTTQSSLPDEKIVLLED